MFEFGKTGKSTSGPVRVPTPQTLHIEYPTPPNQRAAHLSNLSVKPPEPSSTVHSKSQPVVNLSAGFKLLSTFF
jgi:hypothetical protein